MSFFALYPKTKLISGFSFSLVTAITSPHSKPITSFAFSPNTQQEPVLLTTSIDGQIKQWATAPKTKSKRGELGIFEYCLYAQGFSHRIGITEDLWRCSYQNKFRKMPAFDANWSPDGSLYAIAHNSTVSLWDSATDNVVHAFIGPSIGGLKNVRFGGKAGDVLVAGGQYGLISWSLLDFDGLSKLLRDASHG